MNDMQLYLIKNIGCDDETLGLTYIPDSMFEKFKDIIESLNKGSHYGCQPTIRVFRVVDQNVIRPATLEDNETDWHTMHMYGNRYFLVDEYLFDHPEALEQVV